tara:strand:+ start:86 stop:469 length:384 start_codon:yes stop_codon:yes gene_type:complete
MVIPIDVKIDNFYRYYVELINPIIKLRKRELDVLAKLMYYNNEYKDLKEDIRFKIVFDYDTKIKIAKELDISLDVLNNNFSELRNKKIINDNRLSKGFQIYHNTKEHKLTFKFDFKSNVNGKPRKNS